MAWLCRAAASNRLSGETPSARLRAKRKGRFSPSSLRLLEANEREARCQVGDPGAGRSRPPLSLRRCQFLNLYVPSQAQSYPLMCETVTEAWSPARVPVPSKMSQCPRPVVKSSEQWPVALLPDPA
jgi:hypothetical protein